VSRLKSVPAANPRAARSAPAGGARGVYVQSPKSDIFVVLLAISLGAILIGCLLLVLVWNRYNFQIKPTAMNHIGSSSRLALAAISENPEILTTVRL